MASERGTVKLLWKYVWECHYGTLTTNCAYFHEMLTAKTYVRVGKLKFSRKIECRFSVKVTAVASISVKRFIRSCPVRQENAVMPLLAVELSSRMVLERPAKEGDSPVRERPHTHSEFIL